MAHTPLLGYTDAYLDPVTGTYPLGNGYRWYTPGLMRFNVPDDWSPFGPAGINPYAYCRDDPINHSDPSGHMMSGLESFADELFSDISHDASLATKHAAGAAKAPTEETSSFGWADIDTWRRQRNNSFESSGNEFSDNEQLAHFAGPEAGTKKNELARFFKEGSRWVHGSNSLSLEGIAKFRAILSMDKIDGTPWFFRDGPTLRSGEMGLNTIDGLAEDALISKGVNVYGSKKAHLSVRAYSRPGTSQSVFPVLYGIDRNVEMLPISDHYVSKESINIDHVSAIYVPNHKVAEAKRLLLGYGNEALSQRVKGSALFDLF